MSELITLGRALAAANVPGHTDVWSGLGEVMLNGVWVRADSNMLVQVGKTCRWRDRYETETEFVVAPSRRRD